jgi:hypothetical protein
MTKPMTVSFPLLMAVQTLREIMVPLVFVQKHRQPSYGPFYSPLLFPRTVLPMLLPLLFLLLRRLRLLCDEVQKQLIAVTRSPCICQSTLNLLLLLLLLLLLCAVALLLLLLLLRLLVWQ